MIMKTKMILFMMIALFLFWGMGCERETSDIDSMKQKLIGTWEWIVSYGGVVGESKPHPGEELEIIFTDNRVLITHNLEVIDNQAVIADNKKVIQDGSYAISKEDEKYYLTITPKEGEPELYYLSGKREFYINQTSDTLGIGFSTGTSNFSASLYIKVH